jgi:nocturnin
LLASTALSHSSSTSNFVKAPQEALKWENRKELILEEIRRSGADIICLEEVDHFFDFFQPKLSESGFEGIFKPKPSSPCLNVDGNSGPDGCALFYKADTFSCLEKCELSLRNQDSEETNQVAILVKLEVQNTSAAAQDKDDVSDGISNDSTDLPLSLQLCVAVTHLKAKADAVDIRTAQGSHLYSEMKKFCGACPGVVCGDFNAQTTEPVYKHFKQSSDWLESSYFTANSEREPVLTSWKLRVGKESKCTIDYIWYTSQLLRVNAVWKIPSEEEIGENALPGWNYPSDHIALCTTFTFK